MSFYEFLLLVHVLGVFALFGAQTAFWIITLSTRPGHALLTPAATISLIRPTTVLVAVGSLTTVVFGVWLAIYLDGYELWDGWILGSLALWAIGTGVGNSAGRMFPRGPEFWQRGVVLLGMSSLAVLVALGLMIFKPGA